MTESSPAIPRPSRDRLAKQLELKSHELFDQFGLQRSEGPIVDEDADKRVINRPASEFKSDVIGGGNAEKIKGIISDNFLEEEREQIGRELQLPASAERNRSERELSMFIANNAKPPELNLQVDSIKNPSELPVKKLQVPMVINETKPKEDTRPKYQIGQANLNITELNSVKKESGFKKFWEDLGEFGANAWPRTLGKFFNRQQPAEGETKNVPQQTFVAAEVNGTNADWWQDKLRKEGRDSKGNILSESPVVLPKREFAVSGEVKDETKNPFADAVSIYKVNGSTISFLNSIYKKRNELGLSKEIFEEKLKESGVLYSVLKRGVFSELKKELGREYIKNVPNNLLSPENIFVYAHDIFPELLMDEESEIKKSEVTVKLQQALDSTEKPNERDIVMEIWRQLYPDVSLIREEKKKKEEVDEVAA